MYWLKAEENRSPLFASGIEFALNNAFAELYKI